MFNSPRLMRVMGEIDLLVERNFDAKSEAVESKSILDRVVERRGYLWISGD